MNPRELGVILPIIAPVNVCPVKVLVFATDRLRLYSRIMDWIPTEKARFAIVSNHALLDEMCGDTQFFAGGERCRRRTV